MASLLRRFFRTLPESTRRKIKGWIMPRALLFAHRYGSAGTMELEKEIRAKAAALELVDYQVPVLLDLLNLAGRITPVKGIRVCEIGGDGKFGIARLWYSLTGQPVTVCNPYPNTEFSDAELAEMGVKLYRTPFETTPLPPNSFNIIYGCAVLEHIADTHNFSRYAFAMLAPGGLAILHGCPLWEPRIGHHTWLQRDGKQYAMGQQDCPVPDFGHLYMNEEEMHSFLIKEKNVPSLHTDALCDLIYRDNHINRMSITEICTDVISAAPWQEFRFKTEFDYIENGLRNFLTSKKIEIKDIHRAYLCLVAKKYD
jgi:hypothetical protein